MFLFPREDSKWIRKKFVCSLAPLQSVLDPLLQTSCQRTFLEVLYFQEGRGGGEREREGERHDQAETLCPHATAKYLLLHSEAIPPFSSSAQGKQFFLSGSILLCTTWWWYLHLGHQLKIREEKISWNANYRNLGSKWRINLIWHFGFGILSFGP